MRAWIDGRPRLVVVEGFLDRADALALYRARETDLRAGRK
jgi:hypothetical protein